MIKQTFIAGSTAVAIAFGALTSGASAAPLAPIGASQIETAGATIDDVGRRGGRRFHARHHGHGYRGGDAALVGLGAFALGAAIIASQAGPRDCYIERTKVYSPRHGWVIRKEKVCD